MDDKIKPSYYAIIEADVRYDKKLSSTAKLIYAEITALTQKEGYAWASNKYFADNFSISSSQVSRIVSQLANRGYIDVYIEDNYLRKITLRRNEQPLRKKAGGVTQKAQRGVTQKAQHNNTSVNTKDNSITNVIGETPKTYGNTEVNEMFDYWHKVIGYAIQSKRQANRNACSNLIRKHGVNGVKELIDGLSLAQNERYAPQIADFCSLQSKMNELILWGKKNTQKVTVY